MIYLLPFLLFFLPPPFPHDERVDNDPPGDVERLPFPFPFFFFSLLAINLNTRSDRLVMMVIQALLPHGHEHRSRAPLGGLIFFPSPSFLFFFFFYLVSKRD